jgi:hypothetical protein
VRSYCLAHRRYTAGCPECRAVVTASRNDKAERIAVDPSLAEHGSNSTYANWGCRCQQCCDAWAAYMVAQRTQRVERFAAGTVVLPHGSASTYTNWGCRCIDCAEAHRDYDRNRRRAA